MIVQRQQNVRTGTVWIRNDKGKIESKRVVLGISDDQKTEILRGGVSEGDDVISSIKQAAK